VPAPDEDASARAEVRLLVTHYTGALARIDLGRLRSLWDDTQPGPFLVLDELHDPILTWPDLEHQCERLRSRQRQAEIEPTDVRVRLVPPATAIAYAVLSWSYLTVESDTPRAGTSRLLILARRCAPGWRLTSVMEAPLYIPEASGAAGRPTG
jgi:hypothetical protein